MLRLGYMNYLQSFITLKGLACGSRPILLIP